MSEVASEQVSNRKKPVSSPSKHLGGLPAEGFAREHQVLTVWPVSHATLWTWVRKGRFPAPVHFGKRCSMWRVEDVRAFLAQLGQEGAQS